MATTRDTARFNENEALKALANCGLMSSKQLGNWVYDGGSVQQKTQRMLSRLEKRGYILRREIGMALSTSHICEKSRLTVWALTRPGAERVNAQLIKQGFKPWAHHGTDLGTLVSPKHSVIIDFLSKKQRDGYAVIGRAGIRAGIVDKLQFAECDAVIAKRNFDGDYINGVIAIDDTRTSTVDRVARANKTTKVVLIGDSRLVQRVIKQGQN